MATPRATATRPTAGRRATRATATRTTPTRGGVAPTTAPAATGCTPPRSAPLSTSPAGPGATRSTPAVAITTTTADPITGRAAERPAPGGRPLASFHGRQPAGRTSVSIRWASLFPPPRTVMPEGRPTPHLRKDPSRRARAALGPGRRPPVREHVP